MANKTSNNQQQATGKQQVMDKEEKKWKNQSIVKIARPITLEVLVQKQNLKLKRGEKKTI